MSARIAITVNRPREEVERRWRSSEHRSEQVADDAVTFKDAPGDRGTEIHVDLGRDSAAGRMGEAVRKLAGAGGEAEVKDALRHFKSLLEAGEIARSDGTPEGERAGRKRKPRPAQPREDADAGKAGVR